MTISCHIYTSKNFQRLIRESKADDLSAESRIILFRFTANIAIAPCISMFFASILYLSFRHPCFS